MIGMTVTLKTDGTIEEKAYDTPVTLEDLQKAVGGYIETVPYWDKWVCSGDTHNVVVFCNEEGKLDGLPVNVRATSDWHADQSRTGFVVADLLCGDVVIVYGDEEFMASL